MALTNIRLGDYIERSTVNNSDLKYGTELIEGVNSTGVFAPPKGNTDGVDLKPYKIVNNGAFVYNPTRLDLGSLAYRTEGLCIVSHLYMIFYLTEEGKKIIDPQYLYIYFQRDEFRREVTFRNFGSQRPEFNFDDMSEIIIPLPDIDIQRKYVRVYNSLLNNQKNYERGLEDLKLVCDSYIENLRKNLPCEEIGQYIEESDIKNESGNITLVQGVESSGTYMDTRANMDGIDISKYKIVKKGFFAYNPSRINLGSIALRRDEDCIISPMYTVFRVTDTEKLSPEYLSLWLSRSEFHRSTLFFASGSVRDTFDFSLMKEVKIPFPKMEIQESIVEILTTYVTRRNIAQKLNELIKDMRSVLIKGAIQEAAK